MRISGKISVCIDRMARHRETESMPPPHKTCAETSAQIGRFPLCILSLARMLKAATRPAPLLSRFSPLRVAHGRR
jgi:hypothetical protein